ncbi:MAG TPA: hypothetical protein ENJ09_11165 [Planctomycetes bacterium]|nr:hypothetical protein [Planctomycetota bacterium]
MPGILAPDEKVEVSVIVHVFPLRESTGYEWRDPGRHRREGVSRASKEEVASCPMGKVQIETAVPVQIAEGHPPGSMQGG